MKKQIVFSDADIVTIRLALYEAERAVRARAEVLCEKYPSSAESDLKFAKECSALSVRIFERLMGGAENG